MSTSSIKLSPRTRVDELRALRTQASTSRRKITASSLISKISSIVCSSEKNSNNNTLVISKPSVSLTSRSTKHSFKSPRERRFNFMTSPLNNSYNSVSIQSQLTPRPPSKSKAEEPKPLNLQEEFSKLLLPISYTTALKLFRDHLSTYEQSEIQSFSEIYYMGFKCSRHESTAFDDENGNLKLYKGDHLYYRYEILQLLGIGSFGQVCKCFDHKLKQYVAVKLIKNKRRYHHQAEIEIKILTALRKKDAEMTHNIVKIEEYFFFRKHVCLCFELLASSLYDLLKSNEFKGLSISLVRRFAIQLLIALRFTKSLNIIHCDLKPENILLKQANKSGIKIIDFGSSCFIEERLYTYIQSRFYRAPEIILGIPYTMAIDMWSFGCIIVELLTGRPLFPGESEAEQLQMIIEVFGMPPSDVLARATKRKLFFDGLGRSRDVKSSRGRVCRSPGSRPIVNMFQEHDKHFVALIYSCLEWNPIKRITPEQALESAWIQQGMLNTPRRSKESNLL